MTKFILHGWVTSRPTEDNKKFFREMVTEEWVTNILCVYFSQPEDTWEAFYEQDRVLISKASPNKVINFTCASNNIETFKKQIQAANIIYFKAGKTLRLLTKLKTIDKLENLINGKTIAGSSAWACAFSKYYFTWKPHSIINKGLWILNIKTIVHYDKTKENHAKELENYWDKNIKLYRIPEEKFFIIEK